MGAGIHPRLKYPVGQRLAVGAMGIAYGSAASYGQPTISGCSTSGKRLTVAFDKALLKGKSLAVQDYGGVAARSAFSVLVNASVPCAEVGAACPAWVGGGAPLDGRCADPRHRGGACRGATHDGRCYSIPALTTCVRRDFAQLSAASFTGGSMSSRWVPVNIALDSGTTVSVDLSPLNGAAPVAIRYAWGESGNPVGKDVACCSYGSSNEEECLPASCPIMALDNTAVYGGLPANPFIALI